MISHDVMEKRPERDDLAAKMLAWEMENGPVTTEPIRVRDDGGRMIIPKAETLSAARKRGGVAGSRGRELQRVSFQIREAGGPLNRQSEARERIARAMQLLGVQEFPKPCLAGSACGEDKKVETVLVKLQTIRSLMYGEASELNELADRLETFV